MLEGIDIRPARGAADMESVRSLFREYQAWLGVDLCFQGFEDELANLPGRYAPPGGDIFLAITTDGVAGGVAFRPLGVDIEKSCEMKRLYVRDAWRGKGLGRQLADLVVGAATACGYKSMVLDTLPKLNLAQQMYARMGFKEMAPYYENPLPGVVYMKKTL